MKELFEGIKEFSRHEFEKNKDLYRNLRNKQNPHTLFITCSDSRIVPNLITKSLPGELFIYRNVANIVPPYKKASDFLATASAIEYAVNVLKVENIVVCGHSNCGGCKALYENDLDAIPYTKKWLQLAKPVKEKVKKINDNDYKLVEQENIVVQIKNLLSYPFIREKYQNRSLNIYGWYYDIGNGIIYNYDHSKGVFKRIE